MTDQEAQADELLALSSIYDLKDFSAAGEDEIPGGYFCAHIDLPNDSIVKLGPEGKNMHNIQFLPPVLLNFEFPRDYPSKNPPSFTVTCQWLSRSQLTKVCQKLDELWTENENCEILFIWTNFLQNELLQCLGLESPIDLNSIFPHRRRSKRHSVNEVAEVVVDESHETAADAHADDVVSHDSEHHDVYDQRGIQDFGSPTLLLASLLEYDQVRRQEYFNGCLFKCDICFVKKLGELCTQFKECKHVYCRQCIASYLVVKIQDGDVAELGCPHSGCQTMVHPSQVKELVSEELFVRYDRLLLQTSLDTMSDVCYCPRPVCQTPVLKDSEESMLGQCPKCYYVFCTLCLMAYHGSRVPCGLKIDSLRKLRDNYKDASQEEKDFLLKKYGRKVIMQALEETVSLEWIGENTKPCPGCNTPIQKLQGCNKMTCLKCGCYFCYLCNTKLSRYKPYNHYNDLRGQCFGKLFEGLENPQNDEDEEDDDYDFLDDWW